MIAWGNALLSMMIATDVGDNVVITWHTGRWHSSGDCSKPTCHFHILGKQVFFLILVQQLNSATHRQNPFSPGCHATEDIDWKSYSFKICFEQNKPLWYWINDSTRVSYQVNNLKMMVMVIKTIATVTVTTLMLVLWTHGSSPALLSRMVLTTRGLELRQRIPRFRTCHSYHCQFLDISIYSQRERERKSEA